MEPSLWLVLVLAVVQGITEFLPISSDGHLLVVAALLAPGGSLEQLEISDLTIVLHMGTLASILVFYWHRVWRLLSEDRRTARLLVIGTIPAVIIGLPLKKFGEQAILENPLLAGFMLPVTGLALIWGARGAKGQRDYQQLSVWETILIGTFQASAILPGLSRSGTTISSGLRLGLSPRAAGTFSFLLAIPALAGAGVLEVLMMFKDGALLTPVSYLAAGALVAFIVGLGSLWGLVRMLEGGRLQWFAAWCIPLGIGVIVWQLATK